MIDELIRYHDKMQLLELTAPKIKKQKNIQSKFVLQVIVRNYLSCASYSTQRVVSTPLCQFYSSTRLLFPFLFTVAFDFWLLHQRLLLGYFLRAIQSINKHHDLVKYMYFVFCCTRFCFSLFIYCPRPDFIKCPSNRCVWFVLLSSFRISCCFCCFTPPTTRGT